MCEHWKISLFCCFSGVTSGMCLGRKLLRQRSTTLHAPFIVLLLHPWLCDTCVNGTAGSTPKRGVSAFLFVSEPQQSQQLRLLACVGFSLSWWGSCLQKMRQEGARQRMAGNERRLRVRHNLCAHSPSLAASNTRKQLVRRYRVTLTESRTLGGYRSNMMYSCAHILKPT